MDATRDRTDLPTILRAGVKLGLIAVVLVAVFAFLQVRLEGIVELIVCGIILLVGIAAFIVLPGQITRARTIEGIAGAAGIGLASVIPFMVFDIALFQPLGLYSNRWLEIGGGSNWWYHPVWWMVATYITWMGAWIQAHQAAKTGSPSPAAAGARHHRPRAGAAWRWASCSVFRTRGGTWGALRSPCCRGSRSTR